MTIKQFRKVSLSVSGMNISYHQGVVKCLKDAKFINTSTLYSGTSGGAIVSALTACGIDPYVQLECTKNVFKNSIVNESQPIEEILSMLDEYLPSNAHLRCNDIVTSHLCRLKYPLPKSYSIHSYKSKSDLILAITSSSYIPLLLGKEMYINFRGLPHIDGGFLKNRQPVLNGDNDYNLYVDATEHKMVSKEYNSIFYGMSETLFHENTPFKFPKTLIEFDTMLDEKFLQGYNDTNKFIEDCALHSDQV